MRLIVECLSGKRRGARRVIEPGGALSVGRSESASLCVPDDRRLRGTHLTLGWDGVRCLFESEHEVLVGGEPALGPELSHAAWVRAGATDLLVSFELASPPVDEVPPVAGWQEALAALSSLVPRLFAVVDASRGNRVLALLRESVDPHGMLYEGVEAMSLMDVGPYVVQLRADSELLRRLVEEGWGRRWAIFLTSTRPLVEVRTHLRRLLMVKREATGEALYFRYQDPEVLGAFLEVITPRQRAQLYGAVVDELLLEASERRRTLDDHVGPVTLIRAPSPTREPC